MSRTRASKQNWDRIYPLTILLKVEDPRKPDLMRAHSEGKVRLTLDMLDSRFRRLGEGRDEILYSPIVDMNQEILDEEGWEDDPRDALLSRQVWDRAAQLERGEGEPPGESSIKFILDTFLPPGQRIRLFGRDLSVVRWGPIIVTRGESAGDELGVAPVLAAVGRKNEQRYVVSIALRVSDKPPSAEPSWLGSMVPRFNAEECRHRAAEMRRDWSILTRPARTGTLSAEKARALKLRRRADKKAAEAAKAARARAARKPPAKAASLGAASPLERSRARARAAIEEKAAARALELRAKGGKALPKSVGGGARGRRGGGGRRRSRPQSRARPRRYTARRHSRRKPAARGSGTKRKSTRRRFRA